MVSEHSGGSEFSAHNWVWVQQCLGASKLYSLSLTDAGTTSGLAFRVFAFRRTHD